MKETLDVEIDMPSSELGAGTRAVMQETADNWGAHLTVAEGASSVVFHFQFTDLDAGAKFAAQVGQIAPERFTAYRKQ
jgi:hypothetical protein